MYCCRSDFPCLMRSLYPGGVEVPLWVRLAFSASCDSQARWLPFAWVWRYVLDKDASFFCDLLNYSILKWCLIGKSQVPVGSALSKPVHYSIQVIAYFSIPCSTYFVPPPAQSYIISLHFCLLDCKRCIKMQYTRTSQVLPRSLFISWLRPSGAPRQVVLECVMTVAPWLKKILSMYRMDQVVLSASFLFWHALPFRT